MPLPSTLPHIGSLTSGARNSITDVAGGSGLDTVNPVDFLTMKLGSICCQ